jgi:predicted Rossmann-fold nucleotide-binding protein
MGTVAKSVLEHGGHVTGIIPDFLVNREFMLEDAQEHIVTKDYWEPLLAMLEHMTAHAFIRESLWVPYLIADRIEDVLPALENAAEEVLEAGERPKRAVAGTPLVKM